MSVLELGMGNTALRQPVVVAAGVEVTGVEDAAVEAAGVELEGAGPWPVQRARLALSSCLAMERARGEEPWMTMTGCGSCAGCRATATSSSARANAAGLACTTCSIGCILHARETFNGKHMRANDDGNPSWFGDGTT